MNKYLVLVIILTLSALLAASCTATPMPEPAPAPSPAPAPGPAPAPVPAPATPAETDNFRLLISDEVNAIMDFEHVYITISKIGVHEGGEAGVWHEFDLDPQADPDGDNVAGIDR
jgi:hypothetical protein